MFIHKKCSQSTNHGHGRMISLFGSLINTFQKKGGRKRHFFFEKIFKNQLEWLELVMLYDCVRLWKMHIIKLYRTERNPTGNGF